MSRNTGSVPIQAARHAFFEGSGTLPSQLPRNILSSWQRCQSLGLAAERPPAIEPVSDAALRELRERNESLSRHARPELDALAAHAMSAGSIVLLTDQRGWIVDAAGNPQFLDKAAKVTLRPGACWGEDQVGTNAIGTAIVEGIPVEVRGGEHYRAPHQILSCSATPIHDPFGELIGVLDISGDARLRHLHAMGLVRLAAANIEHRYFEQGIDGCDLLRVHADRALLGSSQEGVLAFREGRLVAANLAGLELFSLRRSDLGQIDFAGLFDGPLSRLRSDGVLLDSSGRALYGKVDPRRAPAARYGTTMAKKPSVATIDAPVFDAQAEIELGRATRVLDAGLPVLITGETGTGKDLFARELHRRCARRDRPFVAVNCAAIPEGLIEAELFGYEEGAFTGARRRGSPGLLRQADGGVLFLDEIGDMPASLQPRLLRVLQDRELRPLGGGQPVKVDFALVCATHQDLETAVQDGRFRADLYYRIAHHAARLPSLRELPDRAAIVAALWSRIDGGLRLLDPIALEQIAAYDWPGNYRQLTACLKTLAALHDPGTVIGTEGLPAYLQGAGRVDGNVAVGSMPAAGSMPLKNLTLVAMRNAVEQCDGNVAKAARRLGVSRSTLYRRLGQPTTH